MNSPARILIAAPSSGCGKSTVTVGLMSAFSRRMNVQGFKVGPDYIDPMYHRAATGRPSRNLDAWMLSEPDVLRIFRRASSSAEMSIIEGVMGLFDGAGSDPLDGSSAGMAVLLRSPVILVVDCWACSTSAAALVHGFHTFHPQIHLSGVICNRVAGEQHAAWLKSAIEAGTGVPVVGCLPDLPDLKQPERHLGLFTVAGREDDVSVYIERAADAAEKYLDLDRILEVSRSAADLVGEMDDSPSQPPSNQVRIGVAADEAFCFYYEDNLDELRRCGAEIVPFSPLHDHALPADLAGIYLGGGYPELYGLELSRNRSFISDFQRLAGDGIPVYAECGGLMYLTGGLQTGEKLHPFVGCLPGTCRMTGRLTLGYREVQQIRSGILASEKTSMRGHEFHFSVWEGCGATESAYLIGEQSEGFCRTNIQASYVHIHFGQNPDIARHFVQACIDWQISRTQERT